MLFYCGYKIFNETIEEIVKIYNSISFSPSINNKTYFCLYTTKDYTNVITPIYYDNFNSNLPVYITSEETIFIALFYQNKIYCNDITLYKLLLEFNITGFDSLFDYCKNYQLNLKKSNIERVTVYKALRTNYEIIRLFKNFYNEITNKHLGEHHCPNLDLELVMQHSAHCFFNLDNGTEIDSININNICLSSLYYNNTLYSNSKEYLDSVEFDNFGNLDNFLVVQELIDKLKGVN